MTAHVPHLSHPKYRPDIDGLRAVAVLSVVAFHAFPTLMKGGFIGVDLFFVISGFLISTIIFENLDKGTFSFAEFYARRVKRIFPALLIVLSVSLAFGWFALLADEYKQLGKHTMSGIGFVSNFILWSESGYFDNSAETKPFLHLWSLGIEEQFYFVWPLMCLVLWKLKWRNILFLLVLMFTSLWFNIVTVNVDGVEAFYSPLTRFWELLFGSLLAYCVLYHKNLTESFARNQYIANSLSIFGFLAMGFGFLFVNKNTSFPGFWALIPVIGATSIILSGPNSFFNRLVLSNKIAVWFGLISFPLYLWHWPVLTFLRIVERSTPDKYYRLIAVLLSIGLAWITYRFIEKRVRSSSRYRYLIPIIFLSIATFLVGLTIYFNDGFSERKAVTNSEFYKEVQYQFMGPIWSYASNDICRSEFPYKDQDNLAWWFCMKSSKSPATIILLGNSHANQLYPGFAKNPRLSHHSVISIGTCVVGDDGSVIDPRRPCHGAKSAEQAEFISNIVATTPSLKYAILDGLPRIPSSAYIARLIDRISFLESHGLKVVVFTPHIKPDFHPKACFKSPLNQKQRDCLIPASDRTKVLDGFAPLMNAVKMANPNVLFFEQNDVFCDRNDGYCSFVRDRLPLHRDEVHTSEYASILLQNYFSKWAEGNLPSIFFESTVRSTK
jgi:peptidoglycan/LPS O-acetylase OafA/YrhL